MNTATPITLAALAALTPTVTCLIGIILQRSDVRDLRTNMLAMRKDINVEMQAFRKDVHADLLMIHERVANIEGRQSRQSGSYTYHPHCRDTFLLSLGYVVTLER